MRNRSLLTTLQAEGHQVTLVCLADQVERQAACAVQSLCDTVHLLDVPPRRSQVLGRLKSLLSPWPYGALCLRSDGIRRLIAELAAQKKYDGIICDGVYMLVNLPPTAVPTILNKDDLTYEIMGRFAQHERNPLKRLYVLLERLKAFRLERSACSRVTLVLSCSVRDRDMIKHVCPDANVAVVPNVINISEYPLAMSDDNHTVLYTGAMDWFPNRDAVEFFACQIFPLVLQAVPAARFVVAGRGSPSKWQHGFRAVPQVHFTGAVPRMQDEIARAAVCVVPLRIGSGTRLKILEAAAMGKAVVSTSIGAEGLGLRHGKEILLADSPQEFAEATVQVLTDHALRNSLGAAARQAVERNYSLAALECSIRDALSVIELKNRTC